MWNKDWFTVDRINEKTFVISEYLHPEETHCYLLCGEESALLIDTGLGVCNIKDVVDSLTDLPVLAAATHVHWDHIGGHRHFDAIAVHEAEVFWLEGGFPLSVESVRRMLVQDCELPEGFDPDTYRLFRGSPSRILRDGDSIELGNRNIRVIHTPGHSPGHLCFWDETFRFLFTGDLIYRGTLYANYPSTDPGLFLSSVEKLAEYPAMRIFPGHHSLSLPADLVFRVQDGLRSLKQSGNLIHGSGRRFFPDFEILL